MIGVTQGRKFKPSAMRLIDAAERLFADRGIDNVSLQEIAETAGQSNKFAVQYHFKSREGLIDAVFEARLPEINRRREAHVERLRSAGAPSIPDLLRAIFAPVVEQVDAQGKHHYARFSSQVRVDPRYRRGWFNSRHLAAVTEVLNMLRAATPHLSPADFDLRMYLVIDIFDAGLRMIDNPWTLSEQDVPAVDAEKSVMNTVIAMSAAGLLDTTAV